MTIFLVGITGQSHKQSDFGKLFLAKSYVEFVRLRVMTSVSDKENYLPKAENDQKDILIISGNDSKAAELTKLFTNMGFRVFIDSPSSSFTTHEVTKIVSILIVDCNESCSAIRKRLLSSNLCKLPVICIGNNIFFVSPWDIEEMNKGMPISDSAVFDSVSSIIHMWCHNNTQDTAMIADQLVKDRRYHERRNLINPPQSTPITHKDSTTLSSNVIVPHYDVEKDELIVLLVISKSMNLYNKTQAICAEPPIRCIINGWVDNPQLIASKLGQWHPSLILLDTEVITTDFTLTEWLKAIRANDKQTKIILVMNHEIPNLIYKIIEFNVFGLIPKDASSDIYRKAFSVVHNGELWMPHHVIIQIFSTFSEQYRSSLKTRIDIPRLSLREQSIAELVSQGLTNKEIAKQLNVSPETVKKHLKNIFEKFDLQSRSELASKYVSMLGNVLQHSA